MATGGSCGSGGSRARPLSAIVPGLLRCARRAGRTPAKSLGKLAARRVVDDVARQPHGELAVPIARGTGLHGTGHSTGYSAGTQRYSARTKWCPHRRTPWHSETTAGVLRVLAVLTGSAAAEGVLGTSDGNGSHTKHVVSQKARASKPSASTCIEYPFRTPPASTCSEYPSRTPPASTCSEYPFSPPPASACSDYPYPHSARQHLQCPIRTLPARRKAVEVGGFRDFEAVGVLRTPSCRGSI